MSSRAEPPTCPALMYKSAERRALAQADAAFQEAVDRVEEAIQMLDSYLFDYTFECCDPGRLTWQEAHLQLETLRILLSHMEQGARSAAKNLGQASFQFGSGTIHMV